MHEFEELGAWEAALPAILKEEEPVLVELHIKPGERYPDDFKRRYATQYRDLFRKALAGS